MQKFPSGDYVLDLSGMYKTHPSVYTIDKPHIYVVPSYGSAFPPAPSLVTNELAIPEFKPIRPRSSSIRRFRDVFRRARRRSRSLSRSRKSRSKSKRKKRKRKSGGTYKKMHANKKRCLACRKKHAGGCGTKKAHFTCLRKHKKKKSKK